MNLLKNLFAKVNAKSVALFVFLTSFMSPAFAEGSDDIWSAVDLSGITAKVVAAGVIVITLTMAYKSVGLGKRTIKMA